MEPLPNLATLIGLAGGLFLQTLSTLTRVMGR